MQVFPNSRAVDLCVKICYNKIAAKPQAAFTRCFAPLRLRRAAIFLKHKLILLRKIAAFYAVSPETLKFMLQC